jgi:hypothetical protein
VTSHILLPCTLPNRVIALACSPAKTQQEWDDIIHGRLTVSHLCHNSFCREPLHLVLESPSTNISRNSCVAEGRCLCPLGQPRCRLTSQKSYASMEALLRVRDSAQALMKRLFQCPNFGCPWENDRPADLVANKRTPYNDLFNYAVASNVGQTLYIHLETCKFKATT